MRTNRGFTLIELMVVLVIVAIVGGLVIMQGRSARRNATMASGAYELALRIGGLKSRAMADGYEYVLIVADAANPEGCKFQDQSCGRVIVLREPDAGFPATFQGGYNPEPPFAGGTFVDDGAAQFLARNAQLDLSTTWKPPPPFSSVAANDGDILLSCASRRCFAIRFLPDGEVRPVTKGSSIPAGFAFVLKPIEEPSGAAERRAIFISFPTGIVKTAAITF